MNLHLRPRYIIDLFRHSLRKNLEWILVILSSILLGIWAVKETIALRNILLVSGALLSIYYIVQECWNGELKKQCTIWKVLPIILLALAFVWIITHYLFFSLDPTEQLEELKSTWVRAFFASIIGLGTGLSLRNHPDRLPLLWLGIFIVFLVLLFQYVPRALSQNNLLVPDYDHYLLHLKVNTVLIGMIFLAGVSGVLFDHLSAIEHYQINLRFSYILSWLLGTVIVFWIFVFTIDTRNGIGLSVILYSFWALCAIYFFIRSHMRCPNVKSLPMLLIASIGLCLILYFVNLQTNVNASWRTLLDDVRIGVQIDRYPHWQNINQMGYPKRTDGQFVNRSTYERSAWATAGLRALIDYPYGSGVLKHPLTMHLNVIKKNELIPNAPQISTHSGWLDLGLAFGIPILGLIFSSLLLTFLETTRHFYHSKMTVLGFVVLIMCLFIVCEVATQHGIEILFYLLALLPALIFYKTPINDKC